MATVPVEFERIHENGLISSEIEINSKRLVFTNNKAKCELVIGEEFHIEWWIFGNQNSTLTVKYTAENTTKTAVNKSKIPKNRSRKYDFKFVTL